MIQSSLPFEPPANARPPRSADPNDAHGPGRQQQVVSTPLSVSSAGAIAPVAPVTSPPKPAALAPVLVRHPRARRYVIRVREDGTVRVTIPRWGSRRGAMAFAADERTWIEQQQRLLEEQRARMQLAAKPPEVEHADRERARRELPARLLELAAAHGLNVARISIRDQRWRWGSCSKRGHICLNWRLVRMPDWVRDYVMVHELMHLRRLDHSAKFWKLVAKACPDYLLAREWLRVNRRLSL